MKKSRRHALGQHFLSQPGILRKIVRVVDPQPDEVILEVGPGKGSLTTLLAAEAGLVIGVEKDARLIPELQELNLERTTIVEDDILTADWAGLLRRFGGAFSKAKLAGNIPYAISSPLLARVLESPALFVRCVFLLQREFAERLASGPGSKSYAPLSILVQRRFLVKKHFAVAPGSFSPPPRVESEVVSLVPLPAPARPAADERLLADFLHACFGQRRKTLANNLLGRGIDRETVLSELAAASLDPRVRAEDVPAETLLDIFNRLRASAPLDRLFRRPPGP